MRDDIGDLIGEVRRFYNNIVQIGESLHAGEPVTLGMRAVLEFLLVSGPTTVPEIARNRSVTRQHIQALVNSLTDANMVSLEANPQHKRSSLVALSADGERVIRRMRKRESRLFDRLDIPATPAQIASTTKTLENVRRALHTLEE